MKKPQAPTKPTTKPTTKPADGVSREVIAREKQALGVPKQEPRVPTPPPPRGALLSNNAQFKAFASSIDYGIVVGSKDSRIVDFNRAALEIFGYTEEELRDAPITKIMPERFREKHTAGMKRYNETQQPRNLGKTLRLFGLHKSGKEFPMELALSSWKDLDGETYFTASIRRYSKLESHLTWILASSAVATLTMLAMGAYIALGM